MTISRRRAAAGAGALVAAVAAADAVVLAAHRGDAALALAFLLLSLWLGTALAGVGALLVALRPGNLLGPVLLLGGGALVLEYALRTYAYVGLRHVEGLPLAAPAAWAGFVLDPLFFPACLVLTVVLYPDGELRSRPWRWVTAVTVAVAAARMVAVAVRPGPLPDESFGYDVPWTGPLPAGAADAIGTASEAANTGLVFVLLAAMGSLVLRFRRARGGSRQQFKPLALLMVVAATGLLVQNVPSAHDAGVGVLVGAVTLGLPAALAVAALRYRLWDLDRVVVATIVYAGLAVLVTAVYVGVVVGIAALAGAARPGDLGPAVAATAVVAVLFAPARDRLTRAARRLVYGVRADPYEALAALPHRLADVPGPADVLPGTADALTRGLGAPAARVRAFLEDGGREVAWSPPDAAAGNEGEEGLVVVAVRHLGAVVGDVAVRPSPDRPLGRADLRLLADLAAQAGPAVRGVALTAELRERLEQLRASRERIATAQVEERRRLERDVHDGAQQQLVDLAVRLAAAEALVAAGGAGAAEALRRCRAELDACVEQLRELARGIYPPVLATRGLVPALRARARRAGSEVRVRAGEAAARRLPPAVELAAYFCCLEALQNAAKHAPGATVTISVEVREEELAVEVADDGPGLDPAPVGGGTGLRGMADRVGALGGTLTVVSGGGTRVAFRLPLG